MKHVELLEEAHVILSLNMYFDIKIEVSIAYLDILAICTLGKYCLLFSCSENNKP